jgi:hypothetical protein
MKCIQCGEEFAHKNPNMRLCSEACRKVRKQRQDALCKSGHSRTGQIEACRYCGKKYVVNGTTQAFCSMKCRKANEARLKRAQAKTHPATCIICGSNFMTSRNAKSKTCGPECLTKYKSRLTTERAIAQRQAAGIAAPGEYCMPCPWDARILDYLPPEVESWASASMDPMTNRLDVIVRVNIQEIRECAA